MAVMVYVAQKDSKVMGAALNEGGRAKKFVDEWKAKGYTVTLMTQEEYEALRAD